MALAAVGFLSAQKSPELVVAVGAAPLALVIIAQVARKIEMGVVLIFASAAFVRLSIPTGTESKVVASLVLTGIVVAFWVARMLVVEKRLQLKPAPTNLPLLGFICAAVISLFWGIAFRDPLVVTWSTFPFVQLASLTVMILLPGAFLLVGNCVEDIIWLKVMVGLVLVTGAIGLACEFWAITIPVNVLGIFPMWAAAVSCALAFFDRKLHPWKRVLLLAFSAGWIWYGYFRRLTWLAAWMPSFAALSVVSFRRSKWFIVPIVVASILVSRQYIETTYQGEMAISGQTRLAAWTQNWQVTSKHLLFGTGPAGYAAYYMSYFPSRAIASHSNYIDILSQTGIVGLFFHLCFFGALFWSGYRLCQRLKGQSDFMEGMANAAFAGTVGCIVAMGIGDWLYPFAYTQTIAGFDYAVYNWLLMGTIPALDFMTRPQSAKAKQL
mgnify:CR=1 FL=1